VFSSFLLFICQVNIYWVSFYLFACSFYLYLLTDSQLMEEDDDLSTISRAITLDSEFDRGGAINGNDDSSIYSQIGELF